MNLNQYIDALPILLQLAKRKEPDAIGWIKSRYPIDQNVECIICKQLMNGGKMGGQPIMDHAYLHLKELNLLALL